MAAPVLAITPNPALVDEPPHIYLAGLAPGQRVTLAARQRDGAQRIWSSSATYAADETGTVDLAASAPLASSHAGAAALALFWAMALDPAEPEVSPFVLRGLDPLSTTLTVTVAGQMVARATLKRAFLAPGVTRAEIRECGLVGTFFQPSGSGANPAVLVLGGSSGGLREHQAALLASHGIAAFALAYFATDGLPARLAAIPLEYGETAVEWLATRPGISPDRITVLGASRGAELALLLGAHCPRVGSVITYSPSAVVWGATGADAPAWTYRGQPVQRMPNRVTPEHARELEALGPAGFAAWYSLNLDDVAACAMAAIPVERIAGPVLLISGTDDSLWPSARMGEIVMERLRVCGHPYADQHLRYPGAGHMIEALSIPGLPTTASARRHPATGQHVAYGGNPRDQAQAAAASWQAVLAFLRRPR